MQKFNLFKSVPAPINEYELRNQQISTRLFIIFFILLLAILLGYTFIQSVIKTVYIKAPTFEQYSKLNHTHQKNLKCPCTTISIDYKNFLNLNYTFHQVCHSVYISNYWIGYIDGRNTDDAISIDDFRWTGANTFRALRVLCELMNKTVSESLTQLYVNQYISTTVTPAYLFEAQIESSVQKFISSTAKNLISSLRIIRDTNQGNGLWALAGMQQNLYMDADANSLSLVTSNYSNCTCDNSPKCIRQSSIYRYSDKKLLFAIPGLYLGCLTIEALLQSTLECFYNQTCINQLQLYLAHKSFMNATALDPMLNNRFVENSTIQELVNELMIEKWNRTVSFEKYYDVCQPRHCAYDYKTKSNVIYILITLFGLSGGWITMLRFILPLLVTLGRRNERLPITIPGKLI